MDRNRETTRPDDGSEREQPCHRELLDAAMSGPETYAQPLEPVLDLLERAK